MKLSDKKIGETSIVININCDPQTKHRLLEMGLVPNTEVKVVKKAPLGDPIEIMIRGYELSLRLKEAEKIEVR